MAEDLERGTGYVVDGTVLPYWSWAGHRQLFSGRHRTTGLNVQLVCNLNGRLVWISGPVDGCRHDSAALASSGVLQTLDPATWMATRGLPGLASSRRSVSHPTAISRTPRSNSTQEST